MRKGESLGKETLYGKNGEKVFYFLKD